MATPIDPSDIVAQFGDYYLGKNNQKNLFNQLYKQIQEIDKKIFRVVRTDATRWEGGYASMTPLLQAFQKAYTPNGSLTFKANPIDLFKQKVDTELFPDDITESWLAFLEGDSIDRKKWPFVRWIIEQHLIPQMRQDIAEHFYTAIYVAPTDGVAGTPNQAFDGVEKVIDDFIVDARITPTVLGAIPASDEDFVDYVQTFYDLQDERYRNKIVSINMSYDLARKYSSGFYSKYGSGHRDPDVDMVSRMVDGRKAKVLGVDSMAGKNRIYGTVADNAVLVAKKFDKMKQIALGQPSNPRAVQAYTDFYLAPSFMVPEWVFCSDQV